MLIITSTDDELSGDLQTPMTLNDFEPQQCFLAILGCDAF